MRSTRRYLLTAFPLLPFIEAATRNVFAKTLRMSCHQPLHPKNAQPYATA